MKHLIIALFALLSINVSAQTLYDRVQETIVKPLKEYGIMVGQATTNYHHTRKDLMLTIPLWNTLDTTTNSSVETLNKNAAISKQAGKYQKAYEILLDRLQQLRTSAYESYWWEKNYCDSMMISMSWNPTKDYKTYTTFQKTMPRQFGADYIQVTKIKNNNYSNRNSHLPKWCVAFQLTYASDTTIVGTKPFNIQAYKKAVESAFKKKGIISNTFDYQYSKKYLEELHDLYIACINPVPNIPDHYAAHGDIHFIPKDMVDQFVEEFTTLTNAYLDSHREEAYTFNNFSSKTDLSPALQNHIIYKADKQEAESVAKHLTGRTPYFIVWVNRLTDGRFVVLMSESYGDFRIPKEYWKYKIINDDKKVEY